MGYGVKSYDDDGFINLHSDYSSLVYQTSAAVSQSPVRPTYQGSHFISISSAQKDSQYDMGWIVQYTVTLPFTTSKIVPFYHPKFDEQEIAIMDIINDGGQTWVINVLFSGRATDTPGMYIFVDIKDKQASITSSGYGLTVYDAAGDIIFRDNIRPLRVDEVTLVTHPSSIKTGSRGVCTNSTGAQCHVDFTSDQEATFSSVVATSTKLYHAVTSTYGGLAYENDGSFGTTCGFLNFGNRQNAWAYQSWASFRGTLSAKNGSSAIRAGWKADFSGGAYQFASSSCGYGGLFGALIGIIAAVLTGGAALAVIGGALAGFAVGSLTVASTPSLKVYDADATFDTNNPVVLMATDATYYGLSVSQVSPPPAVPAGVQGEGGSGGGSGGGTGGGSGGGTGGGGSGSGYNNDVYQLTAPLTYWFYNPTFTPTLSYSSLTVNGTQLYAAGDQAMSGTSITISGTTYVKGAQQTTPAGGGSGQYYRVMWN